MPEALTHSKRAFFWPQSNKEPNFLFGGIAVLDPFVQGLVTLFITFKNEKELLGVAAKILLKISM